MILHGKPKGCAAQEEEAKDILVFAI